MRNENIILYSNDETVSSQGWFLLKADKYKTVFILEGGLTCWKDRVSFPKLPADPTKEQLTFFEKKKEVCKFFGGQPQFGGDEQIEQETPKLKAPPKVTVTTKRTKKSREGC